VAQPASQRDRTYWPKAMHVNGLHILAAYQRGLAESAETGAVRDDCVRGHRLPVRSFGVAPPTISADAPAAADPLTSQSDLRRGLPRV
jgi:hypothetical protein